MKLYVAYGSNLNKKQMKYRCPDAKVYAIGEIKDYELQFKGKQNGAFATIAPKQGASVPVAIWMISRWDEKSLDRYEGYPLHYTKENINVSVGEENVEAMVYIMNQSMKFAMPSSFYYDTVLMGYDDFGLDKNSLLDAVKNTVEYIYTKPTQSQEIYHSLLDIDYDYELMDDSDDELEIQDETLSDPFYFSDDMRLM